MAEAFTRNCRDPGATLLRHDSQDRQGKIRPIEKIGFYY